MGFFDSSSETINKNYNYDQRAGASEGSVALSGAGNDLVIISSDADTIEQTLGFAGDALDTGKGYFSGALSAGRDYFSEALTFAQGSNLAALSFAYDSQKSSDLSGEVFADVAGQAIDQTANAGKLNDKTVAVIAAVGVGVLVLVLVMKK